MTSEIQNYFNENGYVIIRKHFPLDLVNLLYSYTLKKCLRLKYKMEGPDFKYYNRNWDGNLGDESSGIDSYNFYGDEFVESILEMNLPNMEEFTGIKLVPTYGFLRLYQKDNELPYHTDRDSCEISTTVFLNHNISNLDFEYNWPIYVEKNNKKIPIILNQGDMLIYKGIEIPHWRDKFLGNNHVQMFLHYNNINRTNNNILDERKSLGIPKHIKK
jgi:hypothetical protein